MYYVDGDPEEITLRNNMRCHPTVSYMRLHPRTLRARPSLVSSASNPKRPIRRMIDIVLRIEPRVCGKALLFLYARLTLVCAHGAVFPGPRS